MTRKAILIESSNVRGYKDLPGAKVDIDNWETFLKSDVGGGWTQDEIIILRKPSNQQVADARNVNADCYTFIAFSGHGHDGSVVLNDGDEFYSIDNLKPKGEKGTLVIDSCRGVAEAKQYAFSTKMEAFANQSRGEIVAYNAQKAESMALYEAREMLKYAHTANAGSLNWMKALKESPKGVVKMYSCSKGEFADEDPKSGGYYTSLLLESVDVWSKLNTMGKVHSTKDAHDYASKKLPKQQNPTYDPSWLTFPFAAKA